MAREPKDEKRVAKSDMVQIIVFRQGDEEYALQIDQIKEVVITPPITRMPQTPAFIRGVANIRGNIIAIVDLEEKFGLRRSQEDAKAYHFTLVVESDEVKMGILVREVPNTLSVSAAEIDEAVHIIQDGQSESRYIRGIIKVNNRLIILIDIFKVMEGDALSAVKKTAAA